MADGIYTGVVFFFNTNLCFILVSCEPRGHSDDGNL